MPVYEFKCERCGGLETRTFTSWKLLTQTTQPRCVHDGSRMERTPSTGTSFMVHGYNAANGYNEKLG